MVTKKQKRQFAHTLATMASWHTTSAVDALSHKEGIHDGNYLDILNRSINETVTQIVENGGYGMVDIGTFKPYPFLSGTHQQVAAHHETENTEIWKHADASIWLAAMLNDDSNCQTLIANWNVEYGDSEVYTAFAVLKAYDLLAL